MSIARSPDKVVSSIEQQVSLRDMLHYGWQVARGMQWLHSQKCLHRDLAARNILVCHDGIVKIADFGLARNVSDSDYYRLLYLQSVPKK